MMKKGLWSPDEDERLVRCIAKYVNGSWTDIARKAGLDRCGKSCRRRWMNHLRPDLKRGRFSMEEINLIIQLQEVLGNRWSDIASHLEGRTDNDVKNLWNTQIKKKLPQLKSRFKLLVAAADHHHHNHHHHHGSHDQSSNSPAVIKDRAASAFHMIDACLGGLTDQASSMFSTLLASGSSDQEGLLTKNGDCTPLTVHDRSMSSNNRDNGQLIIAGYNHDNGYEIINQVTSNGSEPAANASVMIGNSSNCALTAYSTAITGTYHHKIANNTGSSCCYTNQSLRDSINSVHEVNLVPVKNEECTAGEINKLDYLPKTFNLKDVAGSDQAVTSSTNKCNSIPCMLSKYSVSGKINGCCFSNCKSEDGSSLADMVMSCLESKEINKSAHDQLMIGSDQLISQLKNSTELAEPEAHANYSCGSNFSAESKSCGLLGSKLSGADDDQNAMDQQDCVSTLAAINNACKPAISSTDEDGDDDDHHPRDLQHHPRHHLHHRSNDYDHQQVIHIQATDHAPIAAAVAANPNHYTLDDLTMPNQSWEVNHDLINDSIDLIHTALKNAHFADWPLQ